MPRTLPLVLLAILLVVASGCAALSGGSGCTDQELQAYLAQTEPILTRLEAVSPDAEDLAPLISGVKTLRRELAGVAAAVPECAQAAHEYLQHYADWTLVGLRNLRTGHINDREISADFETAAAMRARYLETLANL